MKRILFSFAAIAGLTILAASPAQAQWGHGNSHRGNHATSSYGFGNSYGRSYSNNYSNNFGRSYGNRYGNNFGGNSRYQSFGGWGNSASWHDTSHYDYHPASITRHGNHFDYQPAHYDLHRSGHLHR